MSHNIRKFKRVLASSKSVDQDFRDRRVGLKRKSHFLNKFIRSKLQTDENFRSLLFSALDDLKLCLQHHCGYSVDSLIKAGSLGKGTALKGTSDLDCVLVLNDVENAQDLKDKIDEIKSKLIRCLRSKITTNYNLSRWDIAIERQTRFSVQFTMKKTLAPYALEVVEVDLLPTFDIGRFELDKIYGEMKRSSLDTQQYFSAALTEFQRDFVKSLPPRIKDLIRLVKYWCKTFVKRDDNKVVPSSYLLELITIHAWEKVGKPTTINMAIAFKAVMEELKNYRKLDVAWHCHYNENQEMNSSSSQYTTHRSANLENLSFPLRFPLPMDSFKQSKLCLLNCRFVRVLEFVTVTLDMIPKLHVKKYYYRLMVASPNGLHGLFVTKAVILANRVDIDSAPTLHQSMAERIAKERNSKSKNVTQSHIPKAHSCRHLQLLAIASNLNLPDSVYKIYPHGLSRESILAYCDMSRDGGG